MYKSLGRYSVGDLKAIITVCAVVLVECSRGCRLLKTHNHSTCQTSSTYESRLLCVGSQRTLRYFSIDMPADGAFWPSTSPKVIVDDAGVNFRAIPFELVNAVAVVIDQGSETRARKMRQMREVRTAVFTASPQLRLLRLPLTMGDASSSTCCDASFSSSSKPPHRAQASVTATSRKDLETYHKAVSRDGEPSPIIRAH